MTKTDKSIEPDAAHPAITQEALAQLADGRLAYVKEVPSEDVAGIFPEAPKLDPGISNATSDSPWL